MHGLSERIHELCTRTPQHGLLLFHERKTAWDILNKWVFWCVAQRAAAEWSGPHLPACAEPLIPSLDNQDTAIWLAKQLVTSYSLADESALKLAQDLLGEARRAASGVAVELKRSVERWRMRVLGGKTKLSDATLGVEMKPDQKDPLVSVVLRWAPWNAAGATAEDGRSEHRVQLYTGHYEKMKQAYEAAGHPTGLLHARMFAVVCRYDGLSEDKSAYQVQASLRPRVSPATPPRSRRDLARASPHPHAPRPGRRRCRAR